MVKGTVWIRREAGGGVGEAGGGRLLLASGVGWAVIHPRVCPVIAHRGVNGGSVPHEEITIFLLELPGATPQPRA
jgi:hypothetical protein